MVCFAVAHICGVAIGSPSSAAQADSSWRDHERVLQAARAANDTVVSRAQLRAIHREIGATPRIATRFAALAIATHDRAEAAKWMGAVAAMGSALDSGMLAQFEALEGSGARAALLALRARATSDAGAPTLVFRLPDPDMISEDIAFDAPRSRFLVSSVHLGGIYAKQIPGASPATVKLNADSSWGIFALGVDSARRVLWATTSALPMTAHYSASDSGRSALLGFDLATGALRARFAAPDSGAHALGDLTIGANGSVYAADGLGSGVYVLDSGSNTLRTLVPRGVLVSPQTPALSRDGATLFVPDYAIGIAAVRLATGEVTWIAHSDSLALTGIDGMYRVGNDLILVQNGLEPNRIVRLTLDPAMRRVIRASTLARGAGAANISHATMSRGWLYFIRKSGWDRVADDGTMRAGAAGDAPEIARVRLAP